MSRLDKLVETVETYQALATENYDRIRGLAEQIRGGLCDYIGMGEMTLRLPGAAEGTVRAESLWRCGLFHAAARLPHRSRRSRSAWLCACRAAMTGCASRWNAGKWARPSRWASSTVRNTNSSCRSASRAQLPFYDHIYSHILNWFTDQIERYKNGEYGSRVIGFDFADDTSQQDV
jgi:hypothetical protein